MKMKSWWFLGFVACALSVFYVESTCIPRTRSKRQTRVIVGDSMPVQLPFGRGGPAVPLGQGGPIPLRVVGQGLPPGGARWLPVQSLVNTRKLPDGSVVQDCWDSRTGVHEHGTNWKTWDRWKLSCNNGTIKVLACMTPGGEEVPVGSTKTIDGFWHKCEETDDDVRYTREPSCLVHGKRLHIGDTFKWGNFKRECQDYGYNIVGCYYHDSDGNEKELSIGETVVDGILRHSCQREPGSNNTDRVRYQQSSNGCRYDGQVHKIGASWVARHKRFRCEEDGGVSITACVTDDGEEIEIGRSFVKENIVHRCYRVGNVVYYHAYPCGPEINVPCVPAEPLPNGPALSAKNLDPRIRRMPVIGPAFADSPIPQPIVRTIEGTSGSNILTRAPSVFGAGTSHFYQKNMIC